MFHITYQIERSNTMFSWLSPYLKCNLEFTSDAMKANCITHGGRFHADETFCNVFFGKYLEKAIIYRSQQLLPVKGEYNPDAIIYDFGYGELDHHQRSGNGFHPAENAKDLHLIPYAAFGLVWKKYGRDYCERIEKAYEEAKKNSHSSTLNKPIDCDKSVQNYSDNTLANHLWNYIERNLVLAIDASDNGVFSRTDPLYYRYRILTISTIITLFNMTDFENSTGFDKPLYDAQNFASLIFDTILKKGILEFENQMQSNSIKNSAQTSKAMTPELAISISSITNSTARCFYAHGIFTDVILRKIFPNNTCQDLNLFLTKEDTQIFYHPNPPTANSYDFEPIPTSICGIFWEKYGKKYCKTLQYSEENANYTESRVLKELILGIDAYANGLRPLVPFEYVDYPIYTISDFIKDLNLFCDSEETYQNAYELAFQIADSIFERILQKTLDQIQSREYVEEKIASSTGHLLILEKFAHWKEWLYRSTLPQARDIWFVIFPNNGVYNILAVPSKYTANGYRKGFPTKWHGWNRYQEKNMKPPVPTAISIHPQGIIASTETLEDAIALAQKTFSNGESMKLKRKWINS